ncbi:uncharacterized protein LOC126284262 isoform X3 [Schistocerca gregaria]|uniref:uncharacterized protein LOC126284262 isoform X3 n=1 Tax=Schistocerca gregaria TaxID=7010 RepID=UPI00211E83F7|nr:uncharacterized protein LOC126284262 isoform X3 [Schistocerca gregaria]
MSKRKSAVTLSNVVGVVKEVHYPGKAIVTFRFDGQEERALLYGEKLLVDGKSESDRQTLYEFVAQGSVLKFTCHSFSNNGEDRCNWFITCAWRLHTYDLGSPAGTTTVNVIFGLNSTLGTVVEVTARHCVLSFINYKGEEENVLALASRIFVGGHRVSSKQSLQSVLHVDDAVTFDATPCEPEEIPSNCKWFATVMWRGRRPLQDYDSALEIPQHLNRSNLLGFIKQAAFNPKSPFIKGYGRIIEILNEEYGLALISLRHNHWESMLFHRSVAFLFGLKLTTHNLQEIFKEGDQIRFIAVPAPTKKLMTLWLATQISVAVGSTLLEGDLPPIKCC